MSIWRAGFDPPSFFVRTFRVASGSVQRQYGFTIVAAPDSRRIAQLVPFAERARSAGRNREATELLAQAESLAPSDALVLNALGLQAMRANDLSAARQHL